MIKSRSTIEVLCDLWIHISPKKRFYLKLLIIVMFITSFAEIISLGSVLPFLGLLIYPESTEYKYLLSYFDIKSVFGENIFLVATLILIFSSIFVAFMRLLLLWLTTKVSISIGSDISYEAYKRTLYQPYIIHISRNTSNVIATISTKTNTVIYNAILPTLHILSSLMIASSMILTLLFLNAKITLIALLFFALFYFLIVFLIRNVLQKKGETISNNQNLLIKSLQEGLSGIRDILIDGSQSFFLKYFKKADFGLRRAQGFNYFLGQSPRYIMESSAIIFIAVLAYKFSSSDGSEKSILPSLGVLALAAQKLLPIMQQIFVSWTSLQSGKAGLNDILLLLNQQMPKKNIRSKDIFFRKAITLKDISFRYSKDDQWILHKVNLEIKRGQIVGFIGKTGGGKSTLIDIIMGLLEPSKGSIFIDGIVLNQSNSRSWKAHISHVPQFIFLADSSIKENIAFGLPVEEISDDLINYAAEKAQLLDFVNSLPKGFDTIIGERGMRLSGGQRQRIGIARALYKKSEIIILDEATSSLDNETESSVMNGLEEIQGDITLIVIAHRLSTLKSCSKVFEIKNKTIYSHKLLSKAL